MKTSKIRPPLGSRAAARCGAELRSLTTEDDFERCLDLQRATWGNDFGELVPPTILAISQKVGGVVMGAFEEGELLGFVYGLSGVRDGELAHWSHMLAVREADRGRGIGRDLKEFQREFLLALGINVMYWTYDPLIARNASLNLIALGARPVEYVRDMYGADTGSILHSELGTDRFIVRWDFGEAQCAGANRADTGVAETRPTKPQLEEPSVSQGRSVQMTLPGDAQEEEFGWSLETMYWVEIPRDIDGVKVVDREAAWGWRERTRRILGHLLGSGAECLGLYRTGSANDERFYYVFSERGMQKRGDR